MTRLGIPAIVACGLALLSCTALAKPMKSTQQWRRVSKVTAAETVRVEIQGQSGIATYYIAAPASAVVATVEGPGRLRVLLRPEFTDPASSAEDVHVTVSILGVGSRDLVTFSAPAKLARYAGRPSRGVPGEAVAAYLDLPAGKRAIEITARRRVGVKIYVDR